MSTPARTKKRGLSAYTIYIIVLLISIHGSTAVFGKSAAELVTDAKAMITEIEATEFGNLTKNGAILIDVREPTEFELGHLPGAINIPRGLLEFRVSGLPELKDLDPGARLGKDILLYCRTGGRAALAAVSLQEMGFHQVYSLKGGYLQWIKASPEDAETETPMKP